MKRNTLLLFAGLMLAVAGVGAETAKDASGKWYRGNTHTHTFWSDGKQLPELVADWYKSEGYDFLVLSDHNVLSRGEKWKDITEFQQKHNIVEQSRKKFGDDAVIIKEENGKILVKLNTLEQVRKMVCEPGRYIMIEGTEITGKHAGRPAHANAINIDQSIGPAEGETLAEQLVNYAKDVHEHGQKIGKPVFMQVNHPNWRFSNTAEEVAQATLADGVEVMNPNCSNTGDDRHVDTDMIWDIANALRLKGKGATPLFGCGADDTHDYLEFDGKKSNPGRAWIMVRAKELEPDAITKAMRTGDFYASTGVYLKDIQYDAGAGTLTVTVDAEPDAEYRIDFVGSYKDADLTPTPVEPIVKENKTVWPITAKYDERIGATFKSVTDAQAVYTLTGKELYVRARITWTNAKPLVWEDGKLQPQAWTQPVGWRKYLETR